MNLDQHCTCPLKTTSTPDKELGPEGQYRHSARATRRNRTADPVITSDVLYHLSYGGDQSGAEGSRTPDLCSASAALSQLSYGPRPHGRERIRTSDLYDVNVAL